MIDLLRKLLVNDCFPTTAFPPPQRFLILVLQFLVFELGEVGNLQFWLRVEHWAARVSIGGMG